jgi:NAD-dependent deacetylase
VQTEVQSRGRIFRIDLRIAVRERRGHDRDVGGVCNFATIPGRLGRMAFAPEIAALQDLITVASRAVVLTGLGFGQSVDVELNVSQSDWADHASLETLMMDPARFWAYYYGAATEIAAREPSPGHVALARLQAAGLVSTIIAQSADHLHTKAGAEDVIEMHGNVLTAKCERCGERYGLPEVGAFLAAADDGVPRCTTPGCGFPLRPSGTLWGEPLPTDAVTGAWDRATNADLFIAVDTALRTIPLSLLPSVPLTRGVPLAMIGPTPTQYDRYAQVVIRSAGAPIIEAVADRLLSGDPRGDRTAG